MAVKVWRVRLLGSRFRRCICFGVSHTFEGSDMLCMYAYPGFASRLQLTHTCKKGHAKANVLSDAAFVGSVSRITKGPRTQIIG